MNPIQSVSNIADAISMFFKFIFVVGLCYLINAFVSPDKWWAHWVAFGMGIALMVAWARAIKSIFVLTIMAFVGAWLYKKYGQDARDRFDAWWTARQGANATQTTNRSSASTASLRAVS